MRTRVLDFRLSRAPESLGNCRGDLPRLCGIINEATERLMKAGGETGFWGTWQRMIFNVAPAHPYVTLPRTVARLINLATCNRPSSIQNEFFEFLEHGVGVQPSQCNQLCNFREALDRGNFPTMLDLDNASNEKLLRLYLTEQRDVGKRVLIQAIDKNGTTIRSLDNGVDILGQYVTLQSPFTDFEIHLGANPLSKITGLQKDVTVGDVRIHEVDTVTAESRALTILEPSETTACYRRYYLNGLPAYCCSGQTTVQITAMAKLEFIPVSVDQDYLLISNIPALKNACESVRYSEMDNPQAQAMAISKWKMAIKTLNQELTHYLGREKIAVNFAPFGSDRLERVGIGMI